MKISGGYNTREIWIASQSNGSENWKLQSWQILAEPKIHSMALNLGSASFICQISSSTTPPQFVIPKYKHLFFRIYSSSSFSSKTFAQSKSTDSGVSEQDPPSFQGICLELSFCFFFLSFFCYYFLKFMVVSWQIWNCVVIFGWWTSYYCPYKYIVCFWCFALN